MTRLVIDTAVVSSKCIVESVAAILKARLLLRCCNYSGHIPVEGQSNGTSRGVACIELIRRMLCTGLSRISSPVRSKAINGGNRSRSRSYSVAMLKEERGRRTLTAALSRHKVGRWTPVYFLCDLEGWIFAEQDPNDVEMID